MASVAELAGRLDAALWRADATAADIERLCAEAVRHRVRAVCVNSSRVELAAARLEDSTVKTVALVGFPLGAADRDTKRFETEAAIDLGAQEIEVPLNHGRLREGDQAYVLRELRDIAEAADERPVCAVIEPAWLTREQIVLACQLILDSGVDSVSTGTDVFPGVTVQNADVLLFRESLGARFAIKAAGGIRSAGAALALLEAGANRVGLTGARPELFG